MSLKSCSRILFIALVAAIGAIPSTSDVSAEDVGRLDLQLVSFDFQMQPAHGYVSGFPSVSVDGRYVAFASSAADIVPGDTNGTLDVFLVDTVSHQARLVSHSLSGGFGSGASRSPAISGDGRLVLFVSDAVDLVAGDTNGVADTFVFDATNASIRRVSLSANGSQFQAASFNPAISANGQWAVFFTHSDTSGFMPTELFLRNLDNPGAPIPPVAVPENAPTLASMPCLHAFVSDDGNRIVFNSGGACDEPEASRAFLIDRSGPAGLQAIPSGIDPKANDIVVNDFTPDGRFVLLFSIDPLVGGGRFSGLYVLDLSNGQLTAVPIGSGPLRGALGRQMGTMTHNGNVVVFGSASENLVPGDENHLTDTFAWWRDTGVTALVSLGPYRSQLGDSFRAAISGWGTHVVFVTSNGQGIDEVLERGVPGPAAPIPRRAVAPMTASGN